MNPVLKLFPKYHSTAVQAQLHGQAGLAAAGEIPKAPTAVLKLEAAARAYNSLDHAITDSERLPLQRLVPQLGQYYQGYGIAKAAVTLLIGSGVIPGARERFGKIELQSARDEFNKGVEVYRAQGSSRFGRYSAADWINHSVEDAANGLLMLRRPDMAAPLLGGLTDVRRSIERKRAIDDSTVKAINELFGRAQATFDALIGAAETQAAAAGMPVAAGAGVPVAAGAAG